MDSLVSQLSIFETIDRSGRVLKDLLQILNELDLASIRYTIPLDGFLPGGVISARTTAGTRRHHLPSSGRWCCEGLSPLTVIRLESVHLDSSSPNRMLFSVGQRSSCKPLARSLRPFGHDGVAAPIGSYRFLLLGLPLPSIFAFGRRALRRVKKLSTPSMSSVTRLLHLGSGLASNGGISTQLLR